MTWIAGTASADELPIFHAAISLATQIAAAGDDIERARCRIPPSIAKAMKDSAGLLRHGNAARLESPWSSTRSTQFRVIETLAMADGSVGWCAMIGCDSGYLSAFLDQRTSRARCIPTSGSPLVPPPHQPEKPPGCRVAIGEQGRFPFVSGCHHSEWVWLGCIVHEDGAPGADAKGVPEDPTGFPQGVAV